MLVQEWQDAGKDAMLGMTILVIPDSLVTASAIYSE